MRPEITERIRSAKEHGDLKENAEYAAAKDDQSFTEARIKELEQLLLSAVSVAPTTHDSVSIGSTVTVKDGTEKMQTYTIVGMNEADPVHGKISNDSPVGQALLHRRVGDSVPIETPRGSRVLTIIEIR